MALHYKVKKVRLNYQEGKPEGYKLQMVNQSIIKEEALLEYISRSSHVPQSMVKACMMAIAEAIRYYVINGHKVSFGEFGKFHLKVENTCVDTPEECLADTVKRTTLCFSPNADIKDVLNKAGLREYKTLSDTTN